VLFVKKYSKKNEFVNDCRNLFSAGFVSVVGFCMNLHVKLCKTISGSDKNRPGNQIESPNGRTGLNTFTPHQQSPTMPGYSTQDASRLPGTVFSGISVEEMEVGSHSGTFRSSQEKALSSLFFRNLWIGPFNLKPIGMISVSMENSVF
jgi:hypothetical protein